MGHNTKERVLAWACLYRQKTNPKTRDPLGEGGDAGVGRSVSNWESGGPVHGMVHNRKQVCEAAYRRQGANEVHMKLREAGRVYVDGWISWQTCLATFVH